jgi:hypothetical protein
VQLRRSLVANLQSGDSYALVLVLLLASAFVAIVSPEETWARVIRDAVLAVTVAVGYWTATARRGFLVPRVVVPSIALVFVVLAAVEGATTEGVAAAIKAALAAGVAFLIARDLFDRGRVDAQTVLGALSLYILVGVFFASLYSLVAVAGDGTSSPAATTARPVSISTSASSPSRPRDSATSPRRATSAVRSPRSRSSSASSTW